MIEDSTPTRSDPADTAPQSFRQKRNIRLNGKRTTLVLEPYVWQSVDAILEREGVTQDNFCETVNQARQHSSLASAIRIVALTYFRLLYSLTTPPFWDSDMPASRDAPPGMAAPPVDTSQQLPVLPLAIRRFVQEERRV